jgi:hypothetical protein
MGRPVDMASMVSVPGRNLAWFYFSGALDSFAMDGD